MNQQGIQFGKHIVIPRVLIFIFRGKRVLLLKGAPDKKIWPGLFNGLGGHVEPDETPYTCAIRELEEESGLTGIPLELCSILHIDSTTEPGILVFVYKGEYLDGRLIPSGEGELHWIDPVDIPILPVVPDMRELLPRVIEWNQQDGIFYGRYFYKNSNLTIEFMKP
jgi:8-oxo-dGTP diphosphatase